MPSPERRPRSLALENIYSPDFVKNLFDQMSGSYDRMNYITSLGFSLRWRKQFLRPLVASEEPLEVLDLLTGMGETWGFILEKFPKANVTALDFSTEMLRGAQARNQRKFAGRIRLVQQDALANELGGGRFDLVVCSFGLKTFDPNQCTQLAREVERVLKPGGRFAFVEVSKPDSRILRMLYGFYLGMVIPVLGKALGNPESYRMLWRYVEKFVDAKKAMDTFRDCGLDARYESYFYGCATGFSGTKFAQPQGPRTRGQTSLGSPSPL